MTDISRRVAEAADLVTVALDELLPRGEGPESRLTEAMRYADRKSTRLNSSHQ